MANTTDSGSVDLGSTPGAPTISMKDLTDALWPRKVRDMTVWFTSDLHFGHKNIIKYENRPFDTVEGMNAALVSHWNNTVSEDDVVWIVGDFAMGKIAETLPIAKDLAGQKLLIPGNHDRCWSGLYDLQTWKGQDQWHSWVSKYQDVGLAVEPPVQLITEEGGAQRSFLASHFPYESDGRYPGTPEEFNGQFTNLPLIHGHVHSQWRQKGRQINVGLDAWGGHLVNEIVIRHLLGQQQDTVAHTWYGWPGDPWDKNLPPLAT